jgi:hypothetical protein
MTRTLASRTGNTAGLALLALAAACGNHRRIPVGVQELTLLPGTLVPAFSQAVGDYTVELPYAVEAVRLLARVAEPGGALTLNDFALTSGQASGPFPVAPGETALQLTAFAVDGRKQQSYAIAVRRAPGLRSLDPSVGALDPAFAPDVLDYQLTIAAPTLDLTAVIPDAGVTATVDGRAANSGVPVHFDVALGDRVIPVVVTSADGKVTRTYQVRLRRAAPSLEAEVYVKATNSDFLDGYASAVAADGERMLMGAPLEDARLDPRDNAYADAGAGYVLRRTATGWEPEAYLKATNADPSDLFGYAVGIAGDTVVLGAPQESSDARGVNGDKFNNRAPSSGAAYVFRRTPNGYVLEAYLKASNTGDTDRFGTALAISGDRIAVGAPGEASAARGVGGSQGDDGAPGAGAVYVFRRTGDQWAQEAYIKATNTGAGDRFGSSLALDGDVLVVGAALEDSSASGVNAPGDDDLAPGSGAVYVYRAINGVWQAEAYLKASNTGTDDAFGSSVGVRGDIVVCGAPGEASNGQGVGAVQNNDQAPEAGAVYCFRWSAGAWTQTAYVKASNAGARDRFGTSVAYDGTVLMIGAPGEDGGGIGVDADQTSEAAPDAGAVYALVRDGATWFQRHYVKATNPDARDGFGTAVALAGAAVGVGAPGEDSAAAGVGGNQADNSMVDSGAFYLLRTR